MHDHIVRIVSESGHLRAIGALTTHTASTICQRHNTSAEVTDSLSRSITSGILMASLLKDRQRTALKFEGNGKVGKIIVEADAEGHVRGYAGDPSATLDPEEKGFINILGTAGLLTVTKDVGLRQPYTGTVHLQSGNIADDTAFYLTESEQTPSAVGIGTFLDKEERLIAAGGFLIQSLPPHDDANIESIVDIIKGLPPLSELLLKGETPEEIISKIFYEVPFKILSKTPVAFYCDCSRDRFERGLLSLGKSDLRNLSDEHDEIETVCEFCKEKYYFSSGELKALSNQL